MHAVVTLIQDDDNGYEDDNANDIIFSFLVPLLLCFPFIFCQHAERKITTPKSESGCTKSQARKNNGDSNIKR